MKRLLVFLTMLIGIPFLLAGCSLGAATPSNSGEIEIVMKDNTFSTDVIRVKAGDTITLVLSNEGNKLHEFMIGRDPFLEGNFTEGFAEGFFTGMTSDDIQVNGPVMIMGLPGGDMSGMDMGTADEEMDGMDMGTADEEMDGMDMGTADEEMDGMDMGDADEEMDGMDMSDSTEGGDEVRHDEVEADEEHAEDETGGKFGLFQLPAMELHLGIMFMVDPNMVPGGEVTTITFTVPEDRVGKWEIGCFQEQGQHYDDGMRAIFIVEPSS